MDCTLYLETDVLLHENASKSTTHITYAEDEDH